MNQYSVNNVLPNGLSNEDACSDIVDIAIEVTIVVAC